MAEYALVLPIAAGQTEQMRKAAVELEGRRHDEHRQWLLDDGIFSERVWLQQMPGGTAWSVVHWRCEDITRALRPPLGDGEHERYMREHILGELHGVPMELLESAPINELLVSVEARGAPALSSYTFALPILPERLDDFLSHCSRISAGGDLAEANLAFMRGAGIHRGRIWLQAPPEGMDFPPIAIFGWECDDAHGALLAIQEGLTDFTRYLRDHVSAELCGLDITGRPLHLNDLMVSTHARRSDTGVHPHAALVRRGYTAFAEADIPTLMELFSPDIEWSVAGNSPLSGTYRGRDAVFTWFLQMGELTAGTLQVSIDDVFCNERGAVAIEHMSAKRSGMSLEARQGTQYRIEDGQVVAAHSFVLDDQREHDAFWS